MSEIDIIFLSLVLVAFVGFAGTLAYVSYRDKERPSQSFPKFPFTNIPPFDTLYFCHAWSLEFHSLAETPKFGLFPKP